MQISLLSILLFALVSPVVVDFTIFHDQQHSLYYSFIFLMLILMPILDLYRNKLSLAPKLRPILVWLIIIFTVGFGAIVYIHDRYKISIIYRVNDVVIQQEVATRMLLTHKNPYKETYFNTGLEKFVYSDRETNPALYHFVMEPVYLEAEIPFYFIQSRVFGFFDSRVEMYILFFGMLIAGYYFIKDKENKLLFITLVTFNPLTLRFFLEGRSDMFMFPFLFGAFILLQKKKFAYASLMTGVAFAIKQTAWPLFPFFVYFLYLKTKSYKEVAKYIGIFAAVFAILVLPFILWNPRAFIDSTIFYTTGQSLHSVPISGIGFSTLLTDLHIIKDPHPYYPFFIWQLIFGLPVLFVLLKYLKKNPTVKIMIACYALFLFVFWYFSRYFNDSHLGFISTVLITAYFWPKEEKLD